MSSSIVAAGIQGVLATVLVTDANGKQAPATAVVLVKADGSIIDPSAPALPATAATSAKQDTGNTSLAAIDTKMGLITGTGEYEAAAASATDQVMGATGAAGDYLSHIVIQPATTSPGAVTVKDGTTVIFTFTGGANSVSNLDPITVPMGFYSVSGAFKITTGTNVACLGVGNFT